jgi:hypothetical protein
VIRSYHTGRVSSSHNNAHRHYHIPADSVEWKYIPYVVVLLKMHTPTYRKSFKDSDGADLVALPFRLLFRFSLNLIDMFFDFIEILSLFGKRLTERFQLLSFTLFHVLSISAFERTIGEARGHFNKRGRTISSAAFSLLLNESLDAAPPDLVPPTDPTSQFQSTK